MIGTEQDRTTAPMPPPSAPAPMRGATRARRPLELRRLVALVVTALDVLVLALVVGHVVGPVRQVLGLCACLVVPGLAIVGLLRLRDVVLEVSLTLAVGLASLVLLAQLAITAHLWHLFGLQVGLLVACLPSLVLQVLPPRRGAR